MKYFWFYILVLVFGAHSCLSQTGERSANTAIIPMETIELSQELLELSGLLWMDSVVFAIQDEAGSVFVLDTVSLAIKQNLKFSWPGDYEAIGWGMGAIWIVDSRGVLYQLKHTSEELLVEQMYDLPMEELEFEGLAISQNDEIILLGRKPDKRRLSSGRWLYRYSRESKTLEPYLRIPIAEIKERMLGFNNRQEWSFNLGGALPFSDLIWHAGKKEWLIICAQPAALIALTQEGELINVFELDQQMLPQPESISLGPQNTIYIGTEGLLGPARVMKINY